MNAAVYCRVSTDDQGKEGTSLRTQKEACLAYCKQNDYEVVRQFSETYSGLTRDRPKLNELRNIIRSNDVDVVVIYCLDRLSRDPVDGVIITQELEKHHVTLKSVTEDVDNTEKGKLINYIRGYTSKVEAAKIRERTMRGKIARLKEGKLPYGTGVGIYGYEWDSETARRTINEDEAIVVRNIYAMVINGYSFNKIAIELNKRGIKSKTGLKFHPQNIRRIAIDEVYTGKTYSNKTKRVDNKVVKRPRDEWFLLPDITPQIIDDETFRRAQEARAEFKKARPVREKAVYLFSGFMKCSDCGSSVSGTTLSGKYRYYKCRGSAPTAVRGRICDGKYLKADDLERSIWNKFVEMLTSPLTVLHMMTDMEAIDRQKNKDSNTTQILDKQIKQLRRKLKAYPDKEKNLYSLLTEESITREYVIDEVKKLKNEAEKDQRELIRLLETRKQSTNGEGLKVKLSEVSEAFKQHALSLNNNPKEEIEDKRNLLSMLNFQVVIDPVSGKYEFSFRLIGQIINSNEAYLDKYFQKELGEFEKQYPEYNIDELIGSGQAVPGDSTFALCANQLKPNLVSIEQTSGCLSTWAYSYSL